MSRFWAVLIGVLVLVAGGVGAFFLGKLLGKKDAAKRLKAASLEKATKVSVRQLEKDADRLEKKGGRHAEQADRYREQAADELAVLAEELDREGLTAIDIAERLNRVTGRGEDGA